MYKYILSLCSLLIAFSLSAQQSLPVEKEGTGSGKRAKAIQKIESSGEMSPKEQELQSLYGQLKSLEENAMRQIKTLTENMEGLSPDQRESANQRVEEIKLRFERQSLDVKKKIAELKGDKWLLSQIDEAIDHLDHPEKYRPETKEVKRGVPTETKTKTEIQMNKKKSSGLR